MVLWGLERRDCFKDFDCFSVFDLQKSRKSAILVNHFEIFRGQGQEVVEVEEGGAKMDED